MATYELTLVMDGKATSAKKKTITERVNKTLEVLGGKIVKSEDWGVKDLTFKIKKSTQGAYIHNLIELSEQGSKDLSDKIRTDEEIIRYLLIRV